MSDVPHDYQERLNLREQIARIDKLLVENQKLQSETRKFNRDSWILALAALITSLGAVLAAAVARLPEILAALGLHS